jgi:hypothetical protein
MSLMENTASVPEGKQALALVLDRWETKLPQVYWRGSLLGNYQRGGVPVWAFQTTPRPRFVRIAAEHPTLFNAAFVGVDGSSTWPMTAPTHGHIVQVLVLVGVGSLCR